MSIRNTGARHAVPSSNAGCNFDPHSPFTEAFRTLRTNIQFTGVDNQVRTILVAGATPGCGKTTTTVNLGVTLAQTGYSVLLVDTDLRKPALHRYFNIINEPGLTSLLFDVTMDLNRAVHKSLVENLYILPSGPIPPNPAELLSTEKMKSMINVLANRFDYVLFDSPPVMSVTDAAILSRLVNATLFVLDYGRVTREAAVFALEQLKKVHANIIGAVINGVPNRKGYYSYYHYYYSDSGTSRKKDRKNTPGLEKHYRSGLTI
ncbi:MAG: CpsD/CapB family tyrosine-protein kinase [Bacillota bacterium]